MPLLPPTVSAITEPMKASVIATLRLAKEIGAWRAECRPLVRISVRVAPRLRSNVAHLGLYGGKAGRDV